MTPFRCDVHGVNDGFPRQRFSKECDHAKIECSTNVIGIGQAGHQDHLRRQRAAESRTNGEAVGRRHDEIQKNDIRIVNCGGVERLATGSCGDYRIALLFEPDRNQTRQLI